MKIYQPLRIFLWLLPTFCLAQPANLASLTGTWQQEGYGHFLTIDANGLQVYDVCAVSCVTAEKFTWQETEDDMSLLQLTPDALILFEVNSRRLFRSEMVAWLFD